MAAKQDPAAGESLTSAAIRQSFLDFFEARGHTIVPSASLVPAGDETLLFTNAGMVQFKDVFLGTGSRPYSRVADSQKCMRVAGKHNDLDDVGRDDTHHTFFEMLGNWSFGDYYKAEAIAWAWELLTDVWGLPKDKLYATCFEDELGQIPKDDEAADIWRLQPGFEPDHVLFFGRGENFWEMADTGPCGPDSEIHLDRGPDYCDKQGVDGHVCAVNGDCQRFLELWNLVFIQYNRLDANTLEPLPAKHVDTGMGFERIVSVLQGVDSNYLTDLFTPILDRIQQLGKHNEKERQALLTPYRVIADHARAAAFLIADGVIPGNTGRNYVCRMIIRRASRFGNHAGFEEPFLANVADTVIEEYGPFYPELVEQRDRIRLTLTEEEQRFERTVEAGVEHLETVLARAQAAQQTQLDGMTAFDLYATYGLPLEITRDIAREAGLEVDEAGFHKAMDSHREVSGGGFEQAERAIIDTGVWRQLLKDLQGKDRLPEAGVAYDPYAGLETETSLIGLVVDGTVAAEAMPGQSVALVLPETGFYIESGGQVSDQGTIVSVAEPRWRVRIEAMDEPIEGLIVHLGTVVDGQPQVGDAVLASVDQARRLDIMRNHTATHLLHAALRVHLGEHARQAGSLVAPDRLRFDFHHGEAVTAGQIAAIERWVNDAVLANMELTIEHRPRQEAIAAGAMALFGETYGDVVRTVSIGEREPISLELCGGTHVMATAVIGPFLITSEGSAAAGIRRIEAITGRAALEFSLAARDQQRSLAEAFGSNLDQVGDRVQSLMEERNRLAHQLEAAQTQVAHATFHQLPTTQVDGVLVLAAELGEAPLPVLRQLIDRYRNEHGSGVVVLASSAGGQPVFVAAVTDDLVDRGLHAGDLVRTVAEAVGGSGGGKPTMAQAGGKDVAGIGRALAIVPDWVRDHLSN